MFRNQPENIQNLHNFCIRSLTEISVFARIIEYEDIYQIFHSSESGAGLFVPKHIVLKYFGSTHIFENIQLCSSRTISKKGPKKRKIYAIKLFNKYQMIYDEWLKIPKILSDKLFEI